MLPQETLSSPLASPAAPNALPGERRARLRATLLAVAVGVLLAGFWNFKLVDGLGRTLFAQPLVGDSQAAATGQVSGGFGFLFAMAAGLAASFTACNCVVYAMLPGLTCARNGMAQSKAGAWRALGVFTVAVVLVCALYGLYVGMLGAAGAAHLNARGARMHQAQTVFTGVGLVMLAWGLLAMGWGGRPARALRDALDRPATKAAVMGALVGLFAVGRPYPVFRDFLLYAARAGSPLYAAAVMAVQGLGQIALMVVLFGLLVALFGRRLAAWTAADPARPARVSAFALIAGGAYFIYYWGLAFVVDVGRWGFKLGWYH